MEKLIIDTESFQLTQAAFLIRLLVTLGIGFIIGLEREHDAIKEQAPAFAGIRTFIFVALLGFMGGLVYFLLHPYVFLGILVSVGILTGISYFITASKGDIGATTEFTALISFLLGTLTFLGLLAVSLPITVLVVVLLSAKPRLQSIIGKITGEEFYDLIRFVVMALLLFPFLPDRSMGPYNVINPREIGWVIILTSGLGFIGYLLMKFLGAGKGILLSGIIGGLISSTAVTWVFAKKSRENEAVSADCAIAILAASSIMIIRVFVWTFIFNKALFNTVYPVFLLLFAAAIGITLFFYFKQKTTKKLTSSDLGKSKPLDLQGAMVFGLIYTIILLVVSYANDTLGERGLLVSSAIAGLSDIDAITITVSKLAGGSINLVMASHAVLVASISNTLVKLGIGIWAGSRPLRRYLLIGYGVIFTSGLIALFFLNA